MEQSRRELALFGLTLVGCLAVTVFLRIAFREPPPRFSDLYLIGILILAYRASLRSALLLLAASLALSAYLLAPIDRTDVFQMLSFAALALLVLWITRALGRESPE
jgi:hypothetical protein